MGFNGNNPQARRRRGAVQRHCRSKNQGREKSHKDRVQEAREELEFGGFMAPKELCNIAKKTEEHCFEEEEDLIREYKAMHEGKYLGSWLREDTEGMTAEVVLRFLFQSLFSIRRW